MNRVGQGGARRERLARLLPPRRPHRLRAAVRGARRRRRGPRATAPRRPASRPRWSGPGTASGTGAATTTTARRSARRRATSARSTRSPSPGRCSPARPRRGWRSARWTRSARHLVRRGAQVVLLLDAAVRPLGAGPRLHQGLSARRAGERRAVHPRRGLDGDGARPAGERRRGGRAVPHAQPGEPHAHGGRTSRATRASRTSSPATSTRTRSTPGAAGGPGTRARPAGCTAPGSRASSGSGAAARPSSWIPASPPRGPGTRSPGASAGRATRSPSTNPQRRCRGVARRSWTASRSIRGRSRSSTTAGPTRCSVVLGGQ